MARTATRTAMAAALALAAATAGCSPPAPAALARPITNGWPDAGDPAVAAIRDVATDRVFCTGALIAPRLVLTAAHCAEEPEPLVAFHLAPAAPVELRTVDRMEPHPRFAWRGLENDIALLVLDEPAPVQARSQPLRLWAGALPDPDTALRIVGFGVADIDRPATGERRQGFALVGASEPTRFALVAAPSSTCLGDSGGPVLTRHEGIEYVLGVTSSGDPDCARRATAMRIDAYLDDFILPRAAALGEEVRLSPRAGCDLGGRGETAASGPGGFGLLLAMMAASAIRRRARAGTLDSGSRSDRRGGRDQCIRTLLPPEHHS